MTLLLRTLIITALSAVAITGCNIIPDPAPANIVYRLSLSGQSVTPEPGAIVIRVDRPSSTSVFANRSIIVSPDGRRLSKAAQAQWPENTQIMLQESLVDAFSRNADVVGVLPQSGTRSATRVHFSIKNFEAQFDRGQLAAPLAIVRYNATLTDATDRQLIDTFTIREEVRAGDAKVSDIVLALEKANDIAMKKMVDWVVEADRKGLIKDPRILPVN